VAAVDELVTAVLTSKGAVEPRQEKKTPGRKSEPATPPASAAVVEKLTKVVVDTEAQLCALQCDAAQLQQALTARDARIRSLESALDESATDVARLRASGDGRVAAAERAGEAAAAAAAARARALEQRAQTLVQRVAAAHSQLVETDAAAAMATAELARERARADGAARAAAATAAELADAQAAAATDAHEMGRLRGEHDNAVRQVIYNLPNTVALLPSPTKETHPRRRM